MSEANGPASAAQRSAAVPRPSTDHGADACGRPGPGSTEEIKVIVEEALRHQAEQSRLTYTVDEAAQLLGISRRHTWRLIAQGRIPVVRLGHRTLISRAALAAVLNAPDGRDGSAAGQRRDALLRAMT